MPSQLHSREMYLAYHQLKTAMYGLAIYDSLPESAKEGLPGNFREMFRFGLEYHDISKTIENGWTDELLFSERHPTREEWFEVIKPHPVQAAAVFLQNMITDRTAIDVAEFHHVRFDGESFVDVDEEGRTIPPYAGYPRGVVGANLSLGPRIAKVADAVCAMDEDRPYRNHIYTMEEIMENVWKRRGTEYDSLIAAAFCGIALDSLKEISTSKIDSRVVAENIEKRIEMLRATPI